MKYQRPHLIPGLRLIFQKATNDRQIEAARAIQYLCITVLYQFGGMAFGNKIKVLKKIINTKLEKFEEKKIMSGKLAKFEAAKTVRDHPWKKVLPYYEKILSDFVSDKKFVEKKFLYQEKFGYLLLSKYLMYITERESSQSTMVLIPKKLEIQVSVFLKCIYCGNSCTHLLISVL